VHHPLVGVILLSKKGTCLMSSAGIRVRDVLCKAPTSYAYSLDKYGNNITQFRDTVLGTGRQMTVSESNPRDHKTGAYRSGGKFYTSRSSYFVKLGSVKDAFWQGSDVFFSGPVICRFPTGIEMSNIGFQNPELQFGNKNESQMAVDGTNAISYDNPVNPASNLGTTLAETFREGVPSLPGIQAWKRRTEAAKAAGSEYLNYVFGWAPLAKEVHEVSKAARFHRDIMKQYHSGEGKDTHRRFDYPSDITRAISTVGTELPNISGIPDAMWDFTPAPKRTISLVRERKRWFEGCYTYALPSSTDSWRRSIGFGSDADQLFGLTLTPDLLWELTPWSWAVDWFSNAGEVINNVTNFGLAGLVLRYGYMMEETIETVTAEVGSAQLFSGNPKTKSIEGLRTTSSPCSSGIECVTKRRVPASPFGFSVGWEGLSPTQLAITAALGITKLL